MFIKLISFFLWLFNFSIGSTLKYKVKNEPKGPALFALWHGKTLPLFYWAQHRKVCFMPIETWRGDTMAYLAKRYGYRTIRTKERGTPLERSKSLFKLKNALMSGFDIGIAVDGPPKPLINRKAKPGILSLSRITGAPIVPVDIKMKSKIILFFRWDKYEIPLPWSEVEINFGEPFLPDESTTAEELEEKIHQVEKPAP